MRFLAHPLCLYVMVLLPTGAWAADNPASPTETAAEKLRQALDKVRDLEITDQPLDAAVNQLREQTGINFVIDSAAVPPGFVGVANQPQPSTYGHLRISGRSHGVPVRAALTKMLRVHNLTHVLVGDTVYITTLEKAVERQLEQKVSVNVERMPLSGVLKQLARETGANMVLDPRSVKEGQTALALRLDEVPLETAVELLADEAGLAAVRLGNVLYVTSEARAEKLRKPRQTAAAPVTGWQVWPDGKGGFHLMPPAGAAGAIGFGGGIAGAAGLGGLGGLGALGLGGFNQLGVGGGFAGMGGVPPPVPLTPPLPKTKPPAPDKPKDNKPAPAAASSSQDKPAAKEKPETQAIHPNTRTPRSRRRND
jgi:hypothetical protein